MKDLHNAACPHIKGMRIEDMLEFMKTQKLEAYMPSYTRTGKPPKYDRQWLLNVSDITSSCFNNHF